MAVHRFGAFEFDAATGLLSKHGTPVRLAPQPARVLAMLADRAGTLVTRDELRRAIWSDGTHVDFERGLNFCISQIRTALGDAAAAPRFIETEPKRGYRFIASAIATPDMRAASAATPPPVESRPRWNARVVAIAAALLLAAGIGAAVAARAGDGRVRVAVLPFDNETADSAYEHVAGGIADETVSRLSTPDRLARLDVIGNAAALRRPRAFRDVRAIGRDVRAEYVVLAQLKRDDEGVRLIAHLIRVEDEAHVWAESFDRPDFSLATQTELAELIAAAVAARF